MQRAAASAANHRETLPSCRLDRREISRKRMPLRDFSSLRSSKRQRGNRLFFWARLNRDSGPNDRNGLNVPNKPKKQRPIPERPPRPLAADRSHAGARERSFEGRAANHKQPLPSCRLDRWERSRKRMPLRDFSSLRSSKRQRGNRLFFWARLNRDSGPNDRNGLNVPNKPKKQRPIPERPPRPLAADRSHAGARERSFEGSAANHKQPLPSCRLDRWERSRKRMPLRDFSSLRSSKRQRGNWLFFLGKTEQRQRTERPKRT